jgi:hypothetical protein
MEKGSHDVGSKEKPTNVVLNKLEDVINRLEGNYPTLSEVTDRIGGSVPPEPAATKLNNEISLLNEGDSFLRSIDSKIERIKSLTSDYEEKISRLDQLV